MKLRNGFVSNSSSSSFVAIMRQEDFDALKKNMCALERIIAEEVVNTEDVLGIECAVFTKYSDNGGNGSADIVSENSEGIVEKAIDLASKENIPLLSKEDEEEAKNYDEEEKQCYIQDRIHDYYYGFSDMFGQGVKQNKAWINRQDW